MSQTHTQFSTEAEASFTPEDFGADRELPIIRKDGDKHYQSFTPQRAELTEIVSATYRRGHDGSEITLHETISNGADALLVQAFVGNLNCFPSAPYTARGIPGPALSRIENLNWPKWYGDVPLSIAVAIERSILSRARGTCQCCGEPSGRLPPDYNPIPKSIRVQVRLTLSGPIVQH